MQYFVAVAAGVNFQWRDALTALASLDEKLKAVAEATNDDDDSVSAVSCQSTTTVHASMQCTCTFNT